MSTLTKRERIINFFESQEKPSHLIKGDNERYSVIRYN
jgi:hypothetical protein